MACAISAAHHGLKVIIAEKAPVFGGTTARSGGWLWIPGSALARAQGLHEVPGAARAYLEQQAGASFDAARVETFLQHAPGAVDFFTAHTALAFDMPVVFPDYHAEAPGGAQGGRSMVTRPFDGRELGGAWSPRRNPNATTKRTTAASAMRSASMRGRIPSS